MTALRHPNVVLFMAACTKKGSMCIVMELMALGSLHDFLNNDLVPAVPFALSVKLAYQAAKGMHFLHSYVSATGATGATRAVVVTT
jgi:serine/threonine protein kinase